MTVEGDWAARMPEFCQAGRSMRGALEGWALPCPDKATQYLVSDEIELPRGLSVLYDVHEVLEAWLCDRHLKDLVTAGGWADVIATPEGTGGSATSVEGPTKPE